MDTQTMTIDTLNDMEANTVSDALTRCCGARRWIEGMIASRPYESPSDLLQKAESVWFALDPKDWVEAFSHHPKIGDISSLREKYANTRTWAEGEQSSMQQASEITLKALAEGNQMYEEKFGFIFIVCATGKSANEMVDILQDRLQNDGDRELYVAACEQNKITRLRLEKLLHEGAH